jgi:ABC-type polysaccharide/polyol phosphate export permease
MYGVGGVYIAVLGSSGFWISVCLSLVAHFYRKKSFIFPLVYQMRGGYVTPVSIHSCCFNRHLKQSPQSDTQLL